MYLLGAAAALFGLDQCLKQLVEGQSPERFPRSMDHTGGRLNFTEITTGDSALKF